MDWTYIKVITIKDNFSPWIKRKKQRDLKKA